MQRLINAIHKHRKLRIKQEILSHKFIKFHNESIHNGIHGTVLNPYDDEYRRTNSGVRKIERILPNWYFIVSDIFGGASSIKRISRYELLADTYPDTIN